MKKTTMPTGADKTILIRTLCKRIEAFFEDPVNKQRFEEWQKQSEQSELKVEKETV